MPQKFDEDVVYRTTLPITKPTPKTPVTQVNVRDTATPPAIKIVTPRKAPRMSSSF